MYKKTWPHYAVMPDSSSTFWLFGAETSLSVVVPIAPGIIECGDQCLVSICSQHLQLSSRKMKTLLVMISIVCALTIVLLGVNGEAEPQHDLSPSFPNRPFFDAFGLGAAYRSPVLYSAFILGFIELTTTTTYSTTTVSFTCTMSTTACGKSRRIRAALMSELLGDQFDAKPSPVVKYVHT